MTEHGLDADPRLHFLQHIGLRFLGGDEQHAACEIDLRADLRNSGGMLQGGLTATLIDVAGGILAARVAGTRSCVTADMNIHYLSPGRVGPIRADGSVLRAGRRSIVIEVRVIDTGTADRLVAVGVITMAVLGSRPQPD